MTADDIASLVADMHPGAPAPNTSDNERPLRREGHHD